MSVHSNPWFRPLVALGLLLVATPVLAGEIDELTGLEKANIRTMEVATACFFLAIGCSIGSFLNVVAYRLPRGMHLGKPKSHCPGCSTELGRRENVPVLGWLLLRGRCRHCSIPISPQYPLVEAIVGLLFVGLLFFELLSGGANLPVRSPNTYTGVVWIVWYTKWDLLGLYLFHACLLCVMTTIAMIAIDRERVPWSLVAWSVAVGVALPVVWPTLHPVPFTVPRPEWVAAYDWRMEWTDSIFSAGWTQSIGIGLAGLLDSACGLAGGVLAGIVTGLVEREPRRRRNVHATLAIVGVFLGWQAAISVATATVPCVLLVRGLRRAGVAWDIPTPTIAAVATLAQILAWRWLSETTWCPSHHGWPCLLWPNGAVPQLLVLCGLIAIVAHGVGRLAESPHSTADDVAPTA